MEYCCTLTTIPCCKLIPLYSTRVMTGAWCSSRMHPIVVTKFHSKFFNDQGPSIFNQAAYNIQILSEVTDNMENTIIWRPVLCRMWSLYCRKEFNCHPQLSFSFSLSQPIRHIYWPENTIPLLWPNLISLSLSSESQSFSLKTITLLCSTKLTVCVYMWESVQPRS